ncbi:hypothetical protein IWQ60_004078 [Tieghemiomyces parasiticus]|uniref:Uncharacterized protein n=1 Tax=Tieghemiomyces parasiticus TaxID=78921 RepID=A0A9W8E036_9FUNG|nr:hypothetical protein IWQ60_004078 [Tieghemiomyces parasiticus]
MAHYMASIYGTEGDPIYCTFYHKIGACLHVDSCARKHVHPTYAPVVLLPNFYQPGSHHSQRVLDTLYENLFTELSLQYGEIKRIRICENESEHLAGNVYIQFRRSEDALKAVEALNNRYYDGRPVYAELSPVTNFEEAVCRQHEKGACRRGGNCNFMHLVHPTSALKRDLLRAQDAYLDERQRTPRSHRESRAQSPDRDMSSERGKDTPTAAEATPTMA